MSNSRIKFNNLFVLLKKEISQKKFIIVICIMVLMESFIAERRLFYIEEIQKRGIKLGLYLLAKLGIVFITLFICSVIKKCKDNWNSKRVKIFVISFALIMSIYTIYLILGWPGLWYFDNEVIFCFSLKFEILPQQGVITTLIYIMSLMIIPHPISVVAFQLSVAALVGSYIISYLYTLLSTKKVLWLVILFVSFPAVYFLMQTMRNAVYGYLLLFLQIRFIELFDKKEIYKINHLELLGMSCVVGIESAWRGEGIAVLLLYVLMIIIFLKQLGMKKIITVFCATLMIFLIFNSLDSNAWEKTGAKKAYSLTPFITGISKIVSNQQGNYEQYGTDLQNIDKVISVKDLAEHPSDLAPFNWEVDGVRKDYTNEEYNACIKSICRMIFHNMDLYLNSKWHLMTNSIGLGNQMGYIAGQWGEQQHLEVLKSYGEEKYIELFMPLNERVSTGFYDIMRGYYNVVPYTLTTYYFIWPLWISLLLLVISNIYFFVKRKYIVLLGNLFVLVELAMMFMLCAAEGAYYFSMFWPFGWINLILVNNYNIEGKKQICKNVQEN